VRKPYTSVPVDSSEPETGGKNHSWVPMLNIKVLFNHQMTPFWIPAIVDSGSSHCLFKQEIAQYLHIDLSTAVRGDMAGIIPGVLEPVFYRKVRIIVEGNWTVDITAGFMKKLSTAAILGRNGFFDAFRVTFDHSTSPFSIDIDRILPVQ